MDKLMKNWKTSAAGAALIAEAALTMYGVHIPGFSMDPGTAFMMGMGLLFAKDVDVTGGSKPQ